MDLITAPEYLQDYIMLSQSDNGSDTPKSGMYLDVLEGISTQNLTDVNIEKLATAKALVENKVRFAGMTILNDAWNLVKSSTRQNEWKPKHFAIYKGVKRSNLGVCGVRLKKQIASDYSNIYVDSVSLKVLSNDTITITVTNSDLEIQDTFTVEGQSGEIVHCNIGKSYALDTIYVLADMTTQTCYETDLPYQRVCCGAVRTKDKVEQRGFNGNSLSEVTGYGIIAKYSLQCEIDTAKEAIVDKLKYAILYKAGAEVLKEWLSSTRLNMLSIHSKDWAKETIPQWEQTAVDYMSDEIDNIIRDLSQRDCFCIKKLNQYGSW